MPKLSNQEPKDPHDRITLDILAFSNFITDDILLKKPFPVFLVPLVITNDSCGNYISLIFFLFIVNIVPGSFFTPGFNLIGCVFVSFTITFGKFVIFYNTVRCPWKSFNLVSLIFSKIFKISVFCIPSSFVPSIFFKCLINSIHGIALGSASIFFLSA